MNHWKQADGLGYNRQEEEEGETGTRRISCGGAKLLTNKHRGHRSFPYPVRVELLL